MEASALGRFWEAELVSHVGRAAGCPPPAWRWVGLDLGLLCCLWGLGQGVPGPLPATSLTVQPQGLVSPHPAAGGAALPPRKGLTEAQPHS